MRLVDVRDTSLALREWGEPGSPAILFWHALGTDASGAMLEPVAPALADAGFHVVAIDGPGFGDSPLLPPEEYRLGALAELMHRVVATLDIEPLVVMGHSWGGAVAVTYAAAHPQLVRGLVLLDSGHIDYADLPEVDVSRTTEAWIDAARERHPDNAEARGLAMAGLTDRVSTAWPTIAEHRIPTLVVLATEPPHGDQNREHIGRFAAAVPHAELEWAEGAGHGVIDDLGAPLGERIAIWLKTTIEP